MSNMATRGGVHELRPDVARVRTLMVNTYLLGEPGGPWVLVDAGMPGFANTIRLAARARFGDRPPEAIVMTHGHFDHVGSLGALLEKWDVPLYAHRLELPYLTGQEKYPPPDTTVGGGLMPKLAPLFPPGPFDFKDRARPLPDSGVVPGAPGWRWLHTPGHSRGHVSFFRDADRSLVAGDAFVTTVQESVRSALSFEPRLVRRPPAYYTPDWDAARTSVELLASLAPELALTGHGEPMRGEVLRRELAILARDFDHIARPRPAREPAKGKGPSPALLAAGGAALALLLLRRRRA